MTSRGTMTLTLFMLSFGYHAGAWRLPGSRSAEIGRLGLTRDMAKAAEAAKIHAIFFADSQDVGPLRSGSNLGTAIHEPVSVIGALTGHTERIGMIGTMSTTFGEPYNVARQMAGLDLLSDGRVGWNIVTSVMGQRNFGLEAMPDAEDRYRRGTEFVEVVDKLWGSWRDGAILNDPVSGRWVDPERIVDIDHVGEFFTVRGALNMPRPPQGRPLLVQAGQSEAGIRLGARFADVIYTAQPDFAKSIAFYEDFKRRVAAGGRDPERVRILPGIMPLVAPTVAEARELADELARQIVEGPARAQVSRMVGADVSDLSMDERIPPERLVDDGTRSGRWYTIYRPMAEQLTLRELCVELSRAAGHRWLVGTPGTIAEDLIGWFEARAADGFNLNPPSVPTGMQNMFDLLVPELQERGYFQHEYRGDTLRERMGLEILRPSGRRTTIA